MLSYQISNGTLISVRSYDTEIEHTGRRIKKQALLKHLKVDGTIYADYMERRETKELHSI